MTDRPKSFIGLFAARLLWWGMAVGGATAAVGAPCRIEIVEAGSGWPVPLVELRTTHQMRFFSDNAGVIAFDLPELMGHETWFDVIGNGYEVAKDGFGYRGVRLKPEPGKTLRVEVSRTIIAKRIGRITGAGLFAESQKLGSELEWPESGEVGCDSIQNAVHRGKLFWLWGDTTMANYPLGIFDSTSATSAIQPLRKFEPPLRLKLDYFTNGQGAPRAGAKMPGGEWLPASALIALHKPTTGPAMPRPISQQPRSPAVLQRFPRSEDRALQRLLRRARPPGHRTFEHPR